MRCLENYKKYDFYNALELCRKLKKDLFEETAPATGKDLDFLNGKISSLYDVIAMITVAEKEYIRQNNEVK